MQLPCHVILIGFDYETALPGNVMQRDIHRSMGDKGKPIAWTFEKWLDVEHQIGRQYGYKMMSSTVFIQKLIANNVAKNTEIGDTETPVLPKNEGQIRPLLTDLNHDGERIHVWHEVANSGEKKITAELVQRKVDEFKASGLVVSAAPRAKRLPAWISVEVCYSDFVP